MQLTMRTYVFVSNHIHSSFYVAIHHISSNEFTMGYGEYTASQRLLAYVPSGTIYTFLHTTLFLLCKKNFMLNAYEILYCE